MPSHHSLRMTFGAAVLATAAALGTAGCGRQQPAEQASAPAAAHAPEKKAALTRTAYGTLADGTQVEAFTLTNAGGMEVRAINYGGIVTHIKVPDRNGSLGDVTLGFDSLDGYVKGTAYYGAIVGRYANRIGNARFELDGKTYKLAANNGPSTLHGGVKDSTARSGPRSRSRSRARWA
jgi:aldose 1-epimerase